MTQSSDASGCSYGTPSYDVWYSFVATASNMTVNVAGSADFDAVFEVYSGTCGSLTAQHCEDAFIGGGYTETADLSPFTIGNTYYIRVYDYYAALPSTTTFDICVYETNSVSGPPTTGDCLGAIKICDSYYEYATSAVGIGNVDDLGASTDCGTYEKNATWYTFTVETSGDFTFTVNSTDDYDWALFDISGTESCEDILNGTNLAVSCNFSATTGNTGLDATGTSDSEGASGSPWCQPYAVTAGETYVLLVDNYSSTSTGYELFFSNVEAGILDTISPALYQITSNPSCGVTSLEFDFTELVDTSTVILSDFELTDGTTTYPLTSVTSENGTEFDQSFNLVIGTALTSGGTYYLNLVSDVTDACGNTVASGSLAFTVDGVSAKAIKVNPTCANGNDGSITVYAEGGTPTYTYDWNTGATTATITGLSLGTYTVTVTDNAGAGPCYAVLSVDIENRQTLFEDDFDPSPSAGWVTAATAGSNSWATGDPLGGNGSTTFGTADPSEDYSVNTDNNVYGQGLGSGSGDGLGGYYDSSNEYLRTPAINCSGMSNVQLQFFRFANFENVFDEAYVEVSTNGSTWNDLGHPVYPQDNAWTEVNLDMSAYADNQATVYVRWRMESDISTTYSGWNIDNVSVTADLIAVTAAASATDASCNGVCDGETTVIPGGGDGTYTFEWSDGSSQTTQNATGLCQGGYTVTVTDGSGCTITGSTTVGQPVALTASISSSADATCNGGANGNATASASGGSSPYYYAWPSGGTNATESSLSQGAYVVTITDDNGCTATATANIGEPSAITLTMSDVDASCNGDSDGTATASPSGGTGGFTYAWDGGTGFQTTATATALAAGTYLVTVTDGVGCTAASSATVGQPSAMSLTLTSTAATCGVSNGDASVTSLSGGAGGYTYDWAPNGYTGETTDHYQNLPNGTYTLVVTDGSGCTIDESVAVSSTSGPSATTLVNQNISCFDGTDGSATVNVTGGTSPYTFLWSDGSTGQTETDLAAGLHSITVTYDGGCTDITTVNLTQPNELFIVVSADDLECSGDCDATATVNPSGGTAPYYYLWEAAAGSQTTATATGLCEGDYAVTVTDDNGCTAPTAPKTVTECFEITSILVNSCAGGTEGTQEMFTFEVGPSNIDISAIDIDWPNNSFIGLCTNQDTIDAMNATVTGGGQFLPPVGGNIIPAGAEVFVFTSTAFEHWLFNFQDLDHDVYVIFQCDGNTQGHFANSDNTVPYDDRILSLDFGAGCTDTVAYNPHDINNLDGETVYFTFSGSWANANNGCALPVKSMDTAHVEAPTLIVVSTSATDVTCNGGSDGTATASATGGVAPYDYLWSDGQTTATATNLTASTYTVTVTDANNCEMTQTATVGQNAAVTAVASVVQNVTCAGGANGEATVTPGGGDASYTYLWSTTETTQTITGLSGAAYSVTVTDGLGCIATSSTTVNEDPAVTAVAATVANVTCNGDADGSVTVTPGGGDGSYTYLWTGGATTQTVAGLSGANYLVTVTDGNGCTATSSTIVSENSFVSASASVTANVTCNGDDDGAVNVTPAGGTGSFTYIWTGGYTTQSVTNLSGGAYTVTVTDGNSCTATSTANVNENAVVTATASVDSDVTCNGDGDGAVTVTPTGGTGTYTYNWTGGYTSQSVVNLDGGTYDVTVTDANGCSTTSGATVTEYTAVTAAASTVSDVTCNGDDDGEATVAPGGGTGSYTYLWSNAETTQDITGLGGATYQVTVTDGNGCSANSSATVNENAAITAIASGANASCNGTSDGSVTVAVAGGDGSYIYDWDDPSFSTTQTVNALEAGTYSVTVEDGNGCTTTDSYEVTEPSAITFTTSSVDATCGSANGEAVATAAGGSGAGYVYNWDGTPTGDGTDHIINLSGYTVAVPVEPPLHKTSVVSVVSVKAVGSPITSLSITEQPFASSTVTEYAPAQSPVGFATVCGNGSSHK
jgi:hypothetical protein